VPMLAALLDAVVGVDTHRDTHEVEIALPTGIPIATCQVGNDTAGFAELLAWIIDHAPGPRLAISIEGTRNYGVGLTRAANAAGLLVIECEQPNRKARRGKGKSDPIDAHLAVLAALRLDADRLPVPRVDGDPEALRILLGARQELTTISTRRPTGSARCSATETTPTSRWPAAPSTTPSSPPSHDGANHATPAANNPYGTPRSAASRSPCASPVARCRPTGPSSRRSPTISLPG
jgi:hypothetical protein